MRLPVFGNNMTAASLMFVLLAAAICIQVTLVQGQDCKADIVLVVDQSGSICNNERVQTCDNWKDVVAFLVNVANGLDIGETKVRVGLVVFGSTATMHFDLNEYKTQSALVGALRGLDYKPWQTTDTPGGIRVASEVFTTGRGDRPGVPNVMIILTDGKATTSPTAQAQAAWQKGIRIITIGVTRFVNVDEIKAISSAPHVENKDYFQAAEFNQLSGVLDNLVKSTCVTPTQPTPVIGDCAADFVLIVDQSGSICNNERVDTCPNWEQTVSFLVSIADTLDIAPNKARVALVVFGSSAKLHFDLNEHKTKASLKAALQGLKYVSWQTTDTAGGIQVAMDEAFRPQAGDRANVPNVGIVITDGKATANPIPTAEAARNKNIRLIAVGVTGAVNMDEIKAISSAPHADGTDYFTADKFDQLAVILNNLVASACITTTTSTSTTTTATTQTTTTTTTTTPAPIIGDCAADFVFIVDRSGSICNDLAVSTCQNWERVRDFMAQLIDKMDVSPGASRIALITYGSEARVEWDLASGFSKAEMIEKVRNLQYIQWKTTNTQAALAIARREVFLASRGDRSNANNVAIIVTDGKSMVQPENTLPEATKLKNNRVRIIAVGVTRQIDEDELKGMSSSPHTLGTDYFTSPDFQELFGLLDGLVRSACITTTTTTTQSPDPDCRKRSDVVFLLDASGSIRENNFKMALAFLTNVVDKVSVNAGRTRVGLVTFGDTFSKRFDLDAYDNSADMKAAILATPYTHGRTNTGEALKYVSETMFQSSNGGRADADDLLFILTDGGSNEKEKTVTEALAAKAKGVHIVAMGIGDWVDEYELMSIASYPDRRIEVSAYNQLSRFVDSTTDLLCSRDNPCSSNPCQNGGACVEYFEQYYCRCRDSYGGRFCEYRCRTPNDVVLTIDASGSIGKKNFQKVITFAKEVIMELPIDGATRIGMETFGDNEKIYFHLNSNQDRLTLMNVMTAPYFSGGTTNTASALKALDEQMFTTSRGDQSNRPNVGVLITDGHSDDRRATWQMAMQDRSADIDLIAVGVGDNVGRDELRGVVSAPVDANIFMVDEFDNLNSVKSQVRDAICQAQDPCAQSQCRNGGVCKETRNGYICECPDRFSGRYCERACDGRIDLVFAIDVSGSIRHERFGEVREFIVRVIDELEDGKERVRIAALSFDDNPVLEFRLNEYDMRQDEVQAIRNINHRGGRTNIAGALQMAREQIFSTSNDRRDVPNYLVFFTDGTPTVRELDTIEEAIKARIDGIQIIVVGVGSDLNTMQMRGIASRPHEKNLMTVPRFAQLNSLVTNVVGGVCDDVDECSPNPCRNQASCANGHSMYMCLCGEGFVGRDCERTCRRSYDIVFLLDFSGSVEKAFDITIDFVTEMVYGLPFDLNRVRMGLVTYADTVKVEFNLNSYSQQRDVLNAIAFSHTGGRTNTAEALRVARDEMFRDSAGNRGGVEDVIVLVTDGGGNMGSRQDTLSRAAQLRDMGVQINVVAIGEELDMAEINGIASNNNLVYSIRQESDVKDQARSLLDNLCS